jgi:hypothetical protein
MIVDWLGNQSSHSPAQISQLLGLLRHGIAISVAGSFLSIRLQLLMSDHMVATPAKQLASKAWWHRKRVHITPEVFREETTATVLSDASYGGGISGWSKDFGFLWRIMRQELVLDHGFHMREIDGTGEAVPTVSTS